MPKLIYVNFARNLSNAYKRIDIQTLLIRKNLLMSKLREVRVIKLKVTF